MIELQATTPASEPEENEHEVKRSTSKISRLTATVRQRLNELLFDGLPYEDVLRELGDDAKDLNKMDISRWMTRGGHNRWLQEREWRDHLLISLEAAKDMVEDKKVATIHEANLHLAASQMHNAILGCRIEDLP